MPPQTMTAFSFSKNRNLCPSCSRSVRRQLLIRGLTSRSNAATIATLRITIDPEPLRRSSQRGFHGNDLPAQFALGFVGASKHFLRSHADGVNRGARLTTAQAASYYFIRYARCIGEYIGQFQYWRRQPGDLCQLIENLFQRQVLAAEDIAFAALSF